MQGVPRACYIDTKLMHALRPGAAAGLEDENAIELLQELFWRVAIQILQHAVVGQDLHLVLRKYDAQKIAALPGTIARLINSSGGGAAMVSVGDVERWHLTKFPLDHVYISRFRNDPGGMADAILGTEIDLRRRSYPGRNQLIYRSVRWVYQEYRPSLGV